MRWVLFFEVVICEGEKKCFFVTSVHSHVSLMHSHVSLIVMMSVCPTDLGKNFNLLAKTSVFSGRLCKRNCSNFVWL